MRMTGRFLTGVIVLGLLSPVFAGDRTADEILKEYDALKFPSTAKIQEAQGAERQKLIQEYLAAQKEIMTKQVALIGELYKLEPTNARLGKLLPNRWAMLGQLNKVEEATTEVDRILAESKDDKLKAEAMFFKTRTVLMKEGPESAASLAAIDAFIKAAPKDDRVPQLLMATLGRTPSEAKKKAMEDRIIAEFPESRSAAFIKGERRQKDGIGKPFELEFTDAIKGTTINMKALKGKVVVVDFWATWCGPCVAEMPTMKKLYAEYKDKGVEFIGVSLDQPKEDGGLDKLKSYVTKNDIQWPQYYQGNYWSSDFSSNWGINSIPCIFLIDQDGNLYSTEASRKLETMIPELLKKGKKDAAAGGQ